MEFANGVADPPMANDERLIGYWQLADDKHDVSLAIQAGSPTSLAITVYEDRNCEKAMHLTAVRTQIDERDFLDVTLDGDKGRSNVGPYSYEFSTSAQLSLFPPNVDSLVQAVATKELSGKSSSSDRIITFTEIDAATAELRQWVAAHPKEMRAKQVTLIRSDPVKAPRCG